MGRTGCGPGLDVARHQGPRRARQCTRNLGAFSRQADAGWRSDNATKQRDRATGLIQSDRMPLPAMLQNAPAPSTCGCPSRWQRMEGWNRRRIRARTVGGCEAGAPPCGGRSGGLHVVQEAVYDRAELNRPPGEVARRAEHMAG